MIIYCKLIGGTYFLVGSCSLYAARLLQPAGAVPLPHRTRPPVAGMADHEKKRKTGKPGMLKRLFSSRKLDVSSISLSEHTSPTSDDDKKKPFHRSNTIDGSTFKRPTAADLAAAGFKPQHRRQHSTSNDKPLLQRTISDPKDGRRGSSGGGGPPRPLINVEYANSKRSERISETDGEEEEGADRSLPSTPRGRSRRSKTPPSRDNSLKGRLRNKTISRTYSDVELMAPLEFPCTPELILEHHKRKEMLSPTEEWMLLELNEFECLIDNVNVIKMMAKHSKFFEVEPPELVEEFFLYVEDMSAYDEVLNNDVWLEFRDKKYLCWDEAPPPLPPPPPPPPPPRCLATREQRASLP